MPQIKRYIALGWAAFGEVIIIIIIIIIIIAYKAPGSCSQGDSLCCTQAHTEIRQELLGLEMNKRESIVKLSVTR